MPLDTDNDLLILNDALTAAVGEITHLTGRLLAENGAPGRGRTARELDDGSIGGIGRAGA